MAKAYKCPLTGELREGEGVENFVVNLNENCALLICPQQRLGARKNTHAAITPEAAESIKAKLAELGKGNGGKKS